MLKQFIFTLVVSVLLATPTFSTAKDGCTGECTSCHSLTPEEATRLLKKTGATVTSVKQAPARGLFELLVEREGQKGLLFMDFGKKHLLQGQLVDIEKLQAVSTHPQNQLQPKQQTSLDVKTIPVANAMVMGNPKASKKLYVFTDPDCPYCRKGHVELKKLEKIAPDVAIYVMLFPLPMHPGAYGKSRMVLESKSLVQLDAIFDGKDVPAPVKESSKTAIDENIKFATANGISSTPTMVLPDGTIQVGMRDAETMKNMLEAK